jgi:hypothetical protein
MYRSLAFSVQRALQNYMAGKLTEYRPVYTAVTCTCWLIRYTYKVVSVTQGIHLLLNQRQMCTVT